MISRKWPQSTAEICLPKSIRLKKENYILYLTSDAYCAFEEIVENAVDALNQDIADVIAEIGNELSFDNSVTEIYFDNMEKLVKRFLDCLYDEVLCEW